MTQTSLPAARAAFIDQNGRPTPEFYRFLETLATAQAGNVSPDEITAINAQLAELQAEIAALPSAEIPKLQVTYPILSQGLLQNGFAKLALNQPGDSGAGALKGITLDAWGRVTGTTDGTITGTAGRVTVTNGDAAAGVPTIDLATVADTGGGSLLKFIRDAWGRITGTSAPTTADLAEGANLYYTDARADARITLQKAQPNGIATLDANSKLDAGQLPALAITETFVVSTQAAMLALAAQQGDVCVRTDLQDSFILTTDDPTVLANWQELLTPGGGVASFNGRTGPVMPASGDYTPAQVGLGNVDNTSDANKPVSGPQAAALALKQDASSLGTAAFANTGNVGSGVVPLLSVNAGQTTLALTGVTGRAALSLTTAEADGAAKPVFNISGLGGPSTAGSSEQRVAIFTANTDGPTATKRGGGFGIALKQDNSDALVSRFNIGYLGHTAPGVDNAQTMGSASLRWSVVYAGTGSINTSDARDKTDVAPLTADELAAAADLSRAVGTYQWLESVQLKGADARHHAGLTVQQAIAIMQTHGLDPFAYGFICYDQWDELPEVVDPETGEVTQAYRPAGDRYSFRHDELLLFIARGFAGRLDALESA